MVERDDSLIDAPASEEEVAAANALREALESGQSTEDADVLRALSLAHAPRELDVPDNERLIAAALDRPIKKKNNVVRVFFGVTTFVALAASVFLYVSTHQNAARPTAQQIELVPVRSTQSLFDKPFEAKGTSARVDRIAMAREGDLRENRFARWGVR
jgi:hypothetical protein